MSQISRRALYAAGEPLGDNASYERPGGRVLGGGGSAVNITNWDGMKSPQQDAYYAALTNWQSDVNTNTEAAATAIADARKTMQANYQKEVVNPWIAAQKEIITAQQAKEQSNMLLWQAVSIAIKTAIDLYIADQIDKRMREIAKDTRDLADRQLKMGEELHARYVNKYAPIEDAVADFAKTDWETNRYKPQYLVQQGRAKLDAARAYGKVSGKLNKKFTRYCTGANANMIRQTMSDWARMEIDMVNRAWRMEESQMWRRDDVQWARLQNAIANGQRLPSQAAQDIANGIRTATESNAIRGQAMQGWYGALARGAEGLFQFGYSALEQRNAANYAQIPGQVRNGSLGPTGLQSQQIPYDNGSFGYGNGSNGTGFNADTAGAVSLTGGDATGAEGSMSWFE